MKRLIQKIKDKSALQILQELQWIANYSRRYGWIIALYILLGIIATVISLVATIISKNIIDIVTGYQLGHVVRTAIFYVTLQLITILLSAATNRISTKVQVHVSQEMRSNIFGEIMRAEWEPLADYHSGDLLARFSRDVDMVGSSVIGWVPSLVINSLRFIGTFLVIFWYDKTLALLALASAPIIFLLSGFLSKKIRKHSKEMRQIASETTIFYSEAFRNVRFIKAFHAADTYTKKLFQLHQKQKEATLEHNRFSILTSSFLSFVGMAIAGICFLWSVYRLWKNEITFGEMTLFLQLSGGLSASFGTLVSLVPSAITAATSAGRIMEIAALPTEKIVSNDEVNNIFENDCVARLQAENLCFSYKDGTEIFKNTNFKANSNEVVAVIGSSGEGKTTLLRLILGMLNPQQGTINIYSKKSKLCLSSSPSTRKLFAYVPQDNTLFSGTIAENLRIVNPDATDDMLSEVLKIACAYDFVNALPCGFNTKVGEGGNKLSKGQIQRISIARMLLSKAPILLLDEATSALDIKTERKILNNIMQCREERICIITTHKPSILSICDRAYMISGSNITEIDKTEAQKIMTDF